MNTRFDCPSCNKTLQAPERRAGGRLDCPECGEQVTVPPPIPTKKQGRDEASGPIALGRGRSPQKLKWAVVAGGVLVVGLILVAAIWMFGGSGNATKKGERTENAVAAKSDGRQGDVGKSPDAKQPNEDAGKVPAKTTPVKEPNVTEPAKVTKPVVRVKTSLGDIRIELHSDKAPKTVANFLAYVDDGFYDGTIFHRVVPTFTIQGGGFEPGLTEKKPTRPSLGSESDNGLSNAAGTVAMARAGGPDTATTQFFINVNDNSRILDRAKARDGVGYCVFGRVIGGMDVVDKIKVVRTANRKGQSNVPVEDVRIISIRRE